MNGTLYIVGVGPGDPELITVKAARILEKCPVWLAPAARTGGASTALAIAGQSVSPAGRTILTHHFPMKKVYMDQPADPEVRSAWQEGAGIVLDHLAAGRDVAFPTLGDPAIYSTGFYLADALLNLAPDLRLEIVPGVSSITASATAANLPLCLGDDRLAVLPATFENGRLKEMLAQFDSVVFMKVHRVLAQMVELLAELDLLDQAVLVERVGQDEQRVRRDLVAAARERHHYFSTLIVSRNSRLRQATAALEMAQAALAGGSHGNR